MLPAGIILMWSGAIANIPTGWILCDGANGTPNLKNRFIVGAGDTYAVDANGGAINHNHDFTGDGHNHEIGIGFSIGAGNNYAAITDTVAVTGTTNNANGLPPYYSLAYIMKT